MSNFQVEPTRLTPGVVFDTSTNSLTMYGCSVPENSNSFYLPLLDWIETNAHTICSADSPVTIQINFTYFNSSSLKQIIKVLIKLSELVDVRRIAVTWHCDSPHDDFMEVGLDISTALSIPFKFVYRE